MSNKLSPIEPNLANHTRNLLKKYQLRPNKRLGQNFLIDDRVLNDLLQAAELTSQDTVLEVGSGLGTLTRALARRVRKVISLEKDRRLNDILASELNEFDNVSVLNQDIRTFLSQKDILFDKVVANLPFYLTSPLITGLMKLSPPPSLMVLMVQKEVAERICAQPPKANRMAVLCQIQARCRLVRQVPARSFWPAPEVDAAILKMNTSGISPDPLLEKLVNAGFHAPRKTLANNLSSFPGFNQEILAQCNLNPKVRAEALTLQDWKHLKNCFLGQKNVIIRPI